MPGKHAKTLTKQQLTTALRRAAIHSRYPDRDRVMILLFVKAGHEHRFENFTDDFATWVIFYGPDGGE